MFTFVFAIKNSTERSLIFCGKMRHEDENQQPYYKTKGYVGRQISYTFNFIVLLL